MLGKKKLKNRMWDLGFRDLGTFVMTPKMMNLHVHWKYIFNGRFLYINFTFFIDNCIGWNSMPYRGISAIRLSCEI